MIDKRIYSAGSLFNVGFLLYGAGSQMWTNVLIFFLGIFANQYFLIIGVKSLLAARKKSAFLILKFFVLIFVFLYVMRTMPEKMVLCVLAYIFQLIILILSIKKENKKLRTL